MSLDRIRQLPGHRIVEASLAGTALFTATILPANAKVEMLPAPAAAVWWVLCVASRPRALRARARAAGPPARQEDRIAVGSLFFLQGSAPRLVRRLLLGSLLVSLIVSAVAAAREPFGILVPVFPLSLCAQWASRHGRFPRIPNPDAGRRPSGGSPPG